MRHDGHNPFGSDADWVRAARGGTSWASSLLAGAVWVIGMGGFAIAGWQAVQPTIHTLSHLMH